MKSNWHTLAIDSSLERSFSPRWLTREKEDQVYGQLVIEATTAKDEMLALNMR